MFENDDDQSRQTAGTKYFLSPEMLTGEAFNGRPCDIYAAGVTLYMFVYGRPPFVQTSVSDLYEAIRSKDIEYLASGPTGEIVNPSLIDLLKQLLEKDPHKRLSLDQISVRVKRSSAYQTN